MQKQYSISLIRFFACISIFSCHVMQYYSSPFAWWFNVGVQIFFIISGVLYAQKNVANPFSFIFFRLLRILPAYYILAFCVAFIHRFLFLSPRFYEFYNLIFFRTYMIKGLGHLWFVPAILLCYLFLPYLQSACDEIVHRKKVFWFAVILPLFVAFSYFENYFFPVLAFASAYMIVRLHQSQSTNISLNYKSKKLFCGVLFLTVILIVWSVLRGNSFVINMAHIFLAYSIIYVISFFSPWVTKNGMVSKVMDISDKYSFDFYLVHQVFILGPLSLLAFGKTFSPFILVPLIFALTCVCAFVLNLASRFLSDKFYSTFEKYLPERGKRS